MPAAESAHRATLAKREADSATLARLQSADNLARRGVVEAKEAALQAADEDAAKRAHAALVSQAEAVVYFDREKVARAIDAFVEALRDVPGTMHSASLRVSSLDHEANGLAQALEQRRVASLPRRDTASARYRAGVNELGQLFAAALVKHAASGAPLVAHLAREMASARLMVPVGPVAVRAPEPVSPLISGGPAKIDVF
jgi:hypothetical protein